MTELLIHSMVEFADLIGPCLEVVQPRHIAEIGAEYGGMSQFLAETALRAGGRLTSIDPSPKPAFLDWVRLHPHVTHVAQPSLEALPALRDVDCWVVDGDHNYFTVFHELKEIREACRRDAKPFLAFLHDVSWPAARRDMYYAPERIPEAWRHPFDFEGGTTLGCAELIPNRGFRGAGAFAMARHEGGPRNGVLTAVEDFCAQMRADGEELAWAYVPAVFGLGVLFAMDAPWSDAVASLILPFHRNRLLARLEDTRLANYLAVIDWQDRAEAA